MQCFFAFGLLVTLARGNNISLSDVFGSAHVPELPTLEDVYGSARKASVELRPLSTLKSQKSHRIRNHEDCTFPLEIVILQDNTASFQDDFPNMRDVQLDLMVNGLAEGHPNSKFGVVSFRDKPIYSLGEPAAGDYCLRFEAPLSSNVTALKEVYDTLASNGGADPAESQFTAIVAAAQSTTPGWSSLPDSEVTRLIVVATDSPPHFADDGLNSYGMTAFSGSFDEANAATQCLAEYYPDPAQVKAALNARQTYLAVLVFDGAWWSELPSKAWVWTNTYLDQPTEFVTSLAEDSSNFWIRLNHVIRKIEELECVEPATPVPPVSLPMPLSLPTPAVLPPPVTRPIPTTPQEPCAPCEPCPSCPTPCRNDSCCNAVRINLAERPSHLKLEIDNE